MSENPLHNLENIITNFLETEMSDLCEVAAVSELNIEQDFVGLDLSGEDLRNNNLSGFNLERANLSNTNLQNTDLSNANLARANLSGANLKGVNLSDANISEALWDQNTQFDLETKDLFLSKEKLELLEKSTVISRNYYSKSAQLLAKTLQGDTAYNVSVGTKLADRPELESITSLTTQNVVGFPVTALSLEQHVNTIMDWAGKRFSKVVCMANVHMIMEGHRNGDFAQILEEADIVAPDGMSLVWAISCLYLKRQDRVSGTDLLLKLCEKSEESDASLFFVGSTLDVLSSIEERLEREFPKVKIAGFADFPFRSITEAEDDALVKLINDSGAGIVLVSLGCPKQERWMTNHRDRIHAVMIGLGGAFPIFAGRVKWAPPIVRQLGLEWLYRLYLEPRRLWLLYASTILPFLWLFLKQSVKMNSRNSSGVEEQRNSI